LGGPSLGDAVTRDEAARRAGFPVLTPSLMGPPDAVYVRDLVGAQEVTLVWRPGPALPATPQPTIGLLVTELRAQVEPFLLKKLAGSGVRVEEVAVAGRPGYWISGGPHTLLYQTPTGGEVQDATRVVGDVLLWERDGVTYRVESALGREAAVQLAASLA